MALNQINLSLASNIQKFSGETSENINVFLDTLRQLGQLEQWSPQRKYLILKLNLAGKALEYVNNNVSISNLDNFDELAEALTKKFKKSRSFAEIAQNFSNLVQKPNQSVGALVEEISQTTDLYLEINENSSLDTVKLAERLKAQKLVEALRPEIRFEVLKLGVSKFSEIAKAAKNTELALNNVPLQMNNIAKSTDIEIILKNQIENNKAIQNLTDKLEQEQHKQVNNVHSRDTEVYNPRPNFRERNINHNNYRGRGQQRNRVSCHICGKPHITTKCWYYPTNRMDQYKPRGNNSRGSRGNSRSNNYKGSNKRNYRNLNE